MVLTSAFASYPALQVATQVLSKSVVSVHDDAAAFETLRAPQSALVQVSALLSAAHCAAVPQVYVAASVVVTLASASKPELQVAVQVLANNVESVQLAVAALPTLNVPQSTVVHVFGLLPASSVSCPAMHWQVRSTCGEQATSSLVLPGSHTVHGEHVPSHAPFTLSQPSDSAASLKPALHSHTPDTKALFAGHATAVPSWHGAAPAAGE